MSDATRAAAVSEVATRAEVCAAAISDNFRGDGEILVSCFGNVPSLGARLAKATHAPDLLMTDGIASLVDGMQPISGKRAAPVIEAWMPFRSVFDLLWSGRRHVVMMASQIDRFGNQNFSAVGPHAKPSAQLIGMRGAPGNTISHPTSYWVPNHSKQTFVERVDVVCGIGYDRAAALSPQQRRFHEIRRVISNLGVFDFATESRRMRLASLHPGVSVEEVVKNTAFELAIGPDVPVTRFPTAAELALMRDQIDPEGLANKEVR
jgi:acyl CoA:acetate/3-ketoacid CoA transferase beta subunit